MIQENLLIVLIVLGILQVLELSIALVFLFGIRNRKETPVEKTEVPYIKTVPENRISRREGKKICRSCYAAIPALSKVCPLCNSGNGER